MSSDIIVVGSKAMQHHFPDFPRRPRDHDVICTRELFDATVKDDLKNDPTSIELYQLNEEKGCAIIKWRGIPTKVEYLFSNGVRSFELILSQLSGDQQYCSPEILYSLKKAHIHFPIQFEKHIQDLSFLRSKLRELKGISVEDDLGAVSDLLDTYPALTEMHFKETEKRLGKLRTPNMKGENKEKFFGKSKNFVKSFYVHDDMHKAVAEMHSGSPIYESILKEGKEVETDENLWRKLTVQEKIWCVLEEVYVIALERKILPDLFENRILSYSHKAAFNWALMRVCTTLCDGFFREFAVRAYEQIQVQYNPNYVELFFNSIEKYEKSDRGS